MSLILVTGGSGKTGRRVAARLAERGIAYRVASRSATGPSTVHFDWSLPQTHDATLESVVAIYLVAPTGVMEPLPVMQPFLERALDKGVTRFVLLSASSLEENGPVMGAVHGWLRQNVPSWVVLRPTWFMQNFSEQQHRPTILAEDAIYSATQDGRVGFIDAEDIAAVAIEALTDSEFANGDLILTGPATLSYDEVARLIARAVGRDIRHRRLTASDLTDWFVTGGVPAAFAPTLAAMDTAISLGAENRTTQHVFDSTGRDPGSFEDFVIRNAAAWKQA
ncbi:MAG: ergot alkaloid biosynthesis protein [Devosia sp.]|nr:ergot alkaloid biosynthesis protein [Devosia sp.]